MNNVDLSFCKITAMPPHTQYPNGSNRHISWSDKYKKQVIVLAFVLWLKPTNPIIMCIKNLLYLPMQRIDEIIRI